MRILRLCSVYEPPSQSIGGSGARLDPVGGMQTHTGALTRALAARGVQQEVVTAYRADAPSRDSSQQGVVIHRVGLPIRRLRQLYSLPALPLALRLARHADLVHVHQGEDLAVVPIAFAAARRAGIPLVMTIHTSLANTLRAVDLRTVVLRHVGGRIESAAARAAEAVIVLTPRSKRLLAGAGAAEERILVIPSGVETSLFAGGGGDPFPTLPRPRVLFLGRLAAQKGAATLIRAATQLDAHLLLVGDGPQRAELEEQSRRLGVDGRVTFAGFVDRRRVPDVLRHSDVLVLPSVYEELGSSLLEAMWTGTPIVASRTGGIPDVVEDGTSALLVEPRDAAGFARAVTAVLRDESLAQRLREGAHARAAAYDWEKLSSRVLDVYERVVTASAS